MDPLTIFMITVLALFGSGAGGAALREVRRRRRAAMRRAIGRERHFPSGDGGVTLSLFDVFWDLGASDYALEIMDAQRLLLGDPDEVEATLETLGDRIAAYEGSYGALVDDMLDAIQQFYTEHRQAGDRRRLPTMELRAVKSLPLPDGDPQRMLEAAPERRDRDFEDAFFDDLGQIVDAPHTERRRLREERAPVGGALVPVAGDSREIDIDTVGSLEPLALLQSIFSGNFGDRLRTWFETSDLRDLRRQLDRHLARLYDLYREQVEQDPSFYRRVYDIARRWRDEAERIEGLLDDEPFEGRETALCAEMLLGEDAGLVEHLSRTARDDVDATIDAIHAAAGRRKPAMAGYLLYLNRHAFFPRSDRRYLDLVRRIEFAIHRVQQELVSLRERGII
jgi:hypothetical protein